MNREKTGLCSKKYSTMENSGKMQKLSRNFYFAKIHKHPYENLNCIKNHNLL
jgi:hypothetical protein